MSGTERFIKRAATVAMDQTGRRIPKTYDEMKGHMFAMGLLRAPAPQPVTPSAPVRVIDRSESQEPERWADWY